MTPVRDTLFFSAFRATGTELLKSDGSFKRLDSTTAAETEEEPPSDRFQRVDGCCEDFIPSQFFARYADPEP